MAATDELTTPNRFDRRRERTRQAIITSAINLFAERGIRGTTIEDICDAADIAERTFFNHFPTREHLYEAIGAHRIEGFVVLLSMITQDPRPIEQRLPDFFATIARGVAAQPAYRELVGAMQNAHPSGKSPLARSTAVAAASADFIKDGVLRGEITSKHRPEVLADILLGSVSMAIANWSSDTDFDLEHDLVDSAEALVDLFSPKTAASRRRTTQRPKATEL
jgi:AcrR family transcriptional regulator